MTPRPQTYETEQERKEANRQAAKKYRQKLKDKLKGLVNRNHKQEPINNVESPQQQQQKSKPSGTALFYDKFSGVRIDTKPNQNSPSQPLISRKSNRVANSCIWCGKVCTSKQMVDGKCPFCAKYESPEESQYMSRVVFNVSNLPNDYSYSQKKKMIEEALINYRKRGESFDK